MVFIADLFLMQIVGRSELIDSSSTPAPRPPRPPRRRVAPRVLETARSARRRSTTPFRWWQCGEGLCALVPIMAALVFAGFLVVLPFLILEAYDERNERSDRIDNAGIAHCTTIASCGFLLGVSLLLLGPYFGDRKKVSLLGADGINDWTCLHTPSRPLGGAEQGDRMPDARNVTRRRRKRVRLDARRKNAWMLAWIRVS